VICVDRVDAALTGQPVPAGDHGALRQEIAPVGVSAAYSSWGEAWGSLLQLLLNVVLLVIVGAAGLTAQRAILRRRSASVPEAQRP
jgi:hypothetical protein